MSFNHWLASVKRSLAGAPRLANWLSPVSDSCVVCNGMIKREASKIEAPELTHALSRVLCQGCRGAIPWIRRIQCPRCGKGSPCEDCKRDPYKNFQLNRSAVSYDSTMRSWLALYKYRGLERMGPVLAEMMCPVYERITTSAGGRWDAITYVPISSERAEERGFNQAAEMAKHIAKRYGLPLYSLLERTRHAEKMSFKTRAQRIKDVRGLFAPREAGFLELCKGFRSDGGESFATRHLLSIPEGAEDFDNPHMLTDEVKNRKASRHMNILLVDDIYTTGSTAGECAEALMAGGFLIGANSRVYVMTWAHS